MNFEMRKWFYDLPRKSQNARRGKPDMKMKQK
jgi:hypothetical protein